MRLLKQSTAFTFRIGPFVDDGDGVTAETGLTIAQADIQISKDGGAFAQTSASSPTTTHDTDGWYQCPLTATDTNTLGPLTVQIVEAGALPVWVHFMVVPANVYDSLVDGGDNLQVDAVQISGDSTAADNCELMFDGTGYAGGTTKLGVDVVAVSGDSTAADNLEADYDGTGYNKSNSTIGTCTTNTDMVAAAPTAAANADAVWDEAKSGHTAAGSFGEEVQAHALSSEISALNDLSAAQVNAEVDTALADIHLDHLLAVADSDTPVNDSVIAKLAASDGDWSGFDNTTDSLEALRDRGDAAWTTGGGGSNPTVLQNTTIATLSTQVSFTLTAGSADDDAYNGCMVVVEDASTSTQKAVGWVSDYTGSTKTVTLKYDPAIFTMAAGDTIDIIAFSGFNRDAANRLYLDVTTSGRVGIDWANIENSSATQGLSGTTVGVVSLVTDIDTTGLNNINAQVDTALSDINLDHLLAVADSDDVVDNSVIAKMVSKNATADWSTFTNTTDSLEAIRDRGDANWSAAGSSPLLLQQTTIATLASQTSFTLTAGSADDDAYNGAMVIVTDQSTNTQKAVGAIADYTGSTKTVSLASDPGVFTMAVGDTVDVVAAPTESTADAVWDETSTGHVDTGKAGRQLWTVLDAINSSFQSNGVIPSTSYDNSTMLGRSLKCIRQLIDEPSVGSKFSDTDILGLMRAAWQNLMTEINGMADNPLIARHNVTLAQGTDRYVLPPVVGEILQAARLNASTGRVEFEMPMRSRWNPIGPGINFEGTSIYLDPKWAGSSETLQIDFVPTGDIDLIAATASSVTSTTVVFPSSITTGTLDLRENAYAGALLRLTSARYDAGDTNENVLQQRVITAYDATTRTATVDPAFSPVPDTGVADCKFEVVPYHQVDLELAICLEVASLLLSAEPENKRLANINRKKAEYMRNIRLRLAHFENRYGERFQGDTWDNKRYTPWWFGTLGR